MLRRYDTMALKSLDIFSLHGFPVGLVHAESNLLRIIDDGGAGGWANIIDKYAKATRHGPLLTLPAALAADERGATSDLDNPLFQHVGTNYLKGRLRSHPDVAKRHYSDLIDAQAPFDTVV